MNEKPIVIEREAGPLIGMLHPAAGNQEIGVLMMVAGGPQYRIGGHRQLVLWARKISSCGFPVFRFDFGGMGDSYGEYVEFDNVEDDINAAIDRFFKETPSLKQIVLWGECNACSAALFHAYTDPRIKGLVMLNPWVRTEQGQAKAVIKHYYLDRLKQRSFWIKVFSLKFDFVDSMRSAIQMISLARGASATKPQITAKNAVDRSKPLPERMLEGLSRFKGRIMLVMSGRDMVAREFDDLLQTAPVWQERLAACALVRHDLQYADHTFSTGAWRDQVAAWGINWLTTFHSSPHNDSTQTAN
ncbi:MAG: hydrolase 1, exosortase A system-associated [Azonexaceae bacterium]|nr:hydrolase 1, exosortase A system-associated [Azonexaceae bacterium]